MPLRSPIARAGAIKDGCRADGAVGKVKYAHNYNDSRKKFRNFIICALPVGGTLGYY